MNDTMNDILARLLKKYHVKINHCWQTTYTKIVGLEVLASTTNGTSGIGVWDNRKVYWYYDYKIQTFYVERVLR